jgi:hypothetical protein
VHAQPPKSVIIDAINRDRAAYNRQPYDPDRPPGQVLYADISSRLDPAAVIDAARAAFARRNWEITDDQGDGFVAKYRRGDIEAKLQVFLAGNALRYTDDSTIRDGAQRAMAPVVWINNVRGDLRSALATLTVREQSQAPRASGAPSRAAERLAALKRLFDAGLITAPEYEAKRAEILKDL